MTHADPRPLLAEFNRGVTRARAAYQDDMTATAGFCVRCETNRAGWSRICPACAMKAHRKKAAR